MNIEKAIEILESRERNYKINKKLGVVDKMTEEGREMGEAAGTILRFLQKQQEKIRFKNGIIDEMAIALYGYANLEVLIKCPAEHKGRYNRKLSL